MSETGKDRHVSVFGQTFVNALLNQVLTWGENKALEKSFRVFNYWIFKNTFQ